MGYSTTVDDEWQEFYDDAGGYVYYYNKKTGETQWDEPLQNVKL